VNAGPVHCRIIALIATYGFLVSDATAAAWRFESEATVSAQSETNPRLRSDTEQDVVGRAADVRLGVWRSTETLTLSADTRLQSRRYSKDYSLDRDEYEVNTMAGLRGELHQLTAQAAIGRDTTLNSELGTTGLSQVNLRRERVNLSLAPSWQITERLTAGGSVALQRIHYLENDTLDLVDYRYLSALVQMGYRPSQRSSVALVASTSRLDTDRSESDTNDYYAVLQAQYMWSPEWSASASVGPSWVKIGGVRDDALRYGAALTHQSQYASITASASRAVAPAGRGLLTLREDVGLRFTRKLHEYLDFTVYCSHVRSRDIIPEFSFTYNDVRYLRAELGLGWRFAEDWRLGLSAGGSQQHIIQIDDKGTNYDARLQIAWSRSSDVG
jgi:hypothetical protein